MGRIGIDHGRGTAEEGDRMGRMGRMKRGNRMGRMGRME